MQVHQSMKSGTTWYIITSDEIAQIQKDLIGIEQVLPEQNRNLSREIADIIENIPRRLA